MARPAVRPLPTAVVLAGIAVLAGCSGEPERVALARPSVAAEQYATRLPLSTPPVFWLRPGSAAEPPAARAPAPESMPIRSGDDALLRAAGADRADPDIRSQLRGRPGLVALPPAQLSRLLASDPGSGMPRAERRASRPIED